jgi:predicted TIM-barrel fold metal-dependent hydrolase
MNERAAAAGSAPPPPAEPPAPPVRWSGGAQRPATRLPPGACDCHHHIYDARFAFAAGAALRPGDASIDDYRALQRRLGTTRNVIVQPSSYGTDNRLLLASIGHFGGHARGVSVVDTDVTQAQLRALHQGGVRGIRFNLAPPGATTLAMVRPLAARIAPLGWHVQVNAPAALLLEARAVWADLPVPVVFDHLARLPQPGATRHPAFGMVCGLLGQAKAYVKLSGFYNESALGAPGYADAVRLAAAYARVAPQQVLWGSDWPHPTEQPDRIPDDADLLDAFAAAVPGEAARTQILVDNPARLYEFS